MAIALNFPHHLRAEIKFSVGRVHFTYLFLNSLQQVDHLCKITESTAYNYIPRLLLFQLQYSAVTYAIPSAKWEASLDPPTKKSGVTYENLRVREKYNLGRSLISFACKVDRIDLWAEWRGASPSSSSS